VTSAASDGGWGSPAASFWSAFCCSFWSGFGVSRGSYSGIGILCVGWVFLSIVLILGCTFTCICMGHKRPHEEE
jgi:hypothetical protein